MKNKLIKITNNFSKLIIDDTIIWFSYKTPIAFKVKHSINDTFIAKNQWSRTSGKHINKVKEEVERYVEVDYKDLVSLINKMT